MNPLTEAIRKSGIIYTWKSGCKNCLKMGVHSSERESNCLDSSSTFSLARDRSQCLTEFNTDGFVWVCTSGYFFGGALLSRWEYGDSRSRSSVSGAYGCINSA